MDRTFAIPAVIVCLASMFTEASPTADVAQSAPQIILASENVGQPRPVEQDDYAVAYEAAQACGKLCIYIGDDWCPHCPGARAAFREAAAVSGGACVELGADNPKHRKYIADIQREHGKGRGIPQVIVYQKFGGEWQWKVVVGNKPAEIKATMTNLQAMDKVVGCACVNCTRSCRFGGNCACR